MTVHPDEPYRPEGQPFPAGDVPAEVPSDSPAHSATASPGRTKRLLQVGAVGIAGLVAGSALTFAVTANGSSAGDGQGGPGTGQFGGPGGQGGMGYAPGGQPPGQFGGQGQGDQNGSDQGQGAEQAHPSAGEQSSTQTG